VKISIEECFDLKSGVNEASKLAPFFFYKFFTFDEQFSVTCQGDKVQFNDERAFTMKDNDVIRKYY
jgi:hypothetical protein